MGLFGPESSPPVELNPSLHYLSLLHLALPSILLQSGAPLAITFQTALIGQKGTALLAAWSIVATATNAATVVFNFLVVGVTAKVTKVVAVRAWAQVGARIRLALGMALAMGLLACAALLALQRPLWGLLDASSPLVLRVARSYFFLRVAGVPPQLLVMCTSGILQGYQRVYLVAGLQACRILLDVGASYVSLYVLDWGLVGVGVGTILASSVVAVAGIVCIVLLPPPEGRHKIDVFGSHGANGKSQFFCLWRWRGRRKEAPHEMGDMAEGHEGLLEWAEEGLKGEAEERQQQGEQLMREGARRGGDDDDEGVDAVVNEGMWRFVWDGLNTMLRSALVQATFFLVLFCAAALGMHAVAAHQVLMQLWMVNIYVADGFATAGTIVCSSLAGVLAQARTAQEHGRHLADLRTAAWRVLRLGALTGVVLGGVYWSQEDALIGIFTSDPDTNAQLRSVWPFLALMQPLNSIVFVYDGLIYAAQAFSYMAACLSVGFVVLFLPWIALSYLCLKTLLAAWFAKALLNLVRFVVAAYRIHFGFLNSPPLKGAAPPHRIEEPLSAVTQIGEDGGSGQ